MREITAIQSGKALSKFKVLNGEYIYE